MDILLIDENLDWQAANDPCTLELGNGWRLPTYTEWNQCGCSWRLDQLERRMELWFKTPCCRFPATPPMVRYTPAAQAEVLEQYARQAVMSARI